MEFLKNLENYFAVVFLLLVGVIIGIVFGKCVSLMYLIIVCIISFIVAISVFVARKKIEEEIKEGRALLA